ncbi:hypothetical protein C2S52_005191 [Perilla frutescens var. hirtella]|nr:hypothetical protein C2S52_005191 [Perilla frutescens var. hirtella]
MNGDRGGMSWIWREFSPRRNHGDYDRSINDGRNGGDLNGETGAGFRSEIEEKIEKWRERPLARRRKLLLVPNLGCRKKKRGDRRRRKMKEKNTDVVEKVKLSNKVKFGMVGESSFGDRYGLKIGSGGAGGVDKRLKVGNGGGVILSLAFTPVERIELQNP